MSEQHADQILLVINKQAPSKKRFKQHADQIKFKFLSGDKNWKEYGGTWISQPFDSSEFEYYFIRNIINWNEHASEIEVKRLGKHNVSLWVVAPSQYKNTDAVMQSMGLEEWNSLPEFQKAGFIHEYGGGVRIWDENGNDPKKLFQQAQLEAQICNMMTLGDILSRYQNKLGATGLDFLQGEVFPESMRNFLNKGEING